MSTSCSISRKVRVCFSLDMLDVPLLHRLTKRSSVSFDVSMTDIRVIASFPASLDACVALTIVGIQAYTYLDTRSGR